MRVDKNRIINGATAFIEDEIIAKMTDDKAAQVALSVIVKAARTNPNILNKFFENSIVQTVLEYKNENGLESYEIDGISAMISESVKKYGYFPVVLPAVPFISPREKELKFSAFDVEALCRYIEEAQ